MTGEKIPELERVGQTSRTSIGGNQKGKRGKDMKTFKKVLASALAAAMVVTAFPVTNAEAATAPKLSTKKATIYVGQSKTIKVTLPKGAKITSVKTSKKAVATVKKSGKKVVVKAVKAGKATVTVKVTPKKGKAKSLKATITVKNPTLTVKAAATELAVGETTTITAKATPKKTVSFKSSDETIATVDATTGAVKAVKAGTVKITATAGKLTKDVELTIKNIIFKDLAQNTVSTFTATVAGNTKDLKPADFTFVNVATKANVAIKSVAVDKKDATKVVITTFAELKDGKEYAVTLDGTTKNVTVTDGKVASVSVTPTEIPYGVETTIGLVAKDANGVLIAQSDDNGNVPAGYEITLTTKTGYANGNKLYLTNKGDTATAKAVKHSYKYENGKEIETVESGDVTITAVDYSAFSGFAVRLQSGAATKFDEAKDGNTMAVNSHASAFVKITDANGKEVTSDVYAKYSLASSDAGVLMISGSFAGQSSPIRLDALKTGTAYILVKDLNGNVVASLPIVIQDEAHPATLTADKTAAVVSKTLSGDTAVVNLSAKDQYEKKFDINSNVTVKCIATSAKNLTAKLVNDNDTDYFTVSNGTVTFINTTVAEGTYAYEIKYTKNVAGKDFTTNSVYVTVEVKNANANAAVDYKLEAAATTVDTTIDAQHKAAITVPVKMYEVKGGVKTGVVTGNLVEYKVEKDGKTVSTTTGAIAGTGVGFQKDDASNQLTVCALGISGTTATKLAAGKYTITASVTNGTQKYTRTVDITVTDNQAKVIPNVKKTSVAVGDLSSGTTFADLVADNNVMTFTYGGNSYTVASADVKAVEGNYQTGNGIPAVLTKASDLAQNTASVALKNGESNTVSVRKVTVEIKDNGLTYNVDIALDKTFTITK